jgi:hypothetical protein
LNLQKSNNYHPQREAQHFSSEYAFKNSEIQSAFGGRGVLSAVFSLLKNSSEKVYFSLIRFFWTSKRNEYKNNSLSKAKCKQLCEGAMEKRIEEKTIKLCLYPPYPPWAENKGNSETLKL